MEGARAPGRLVTLEGPDGAGKSGQAEQLVAWLRREGHRVTATREPGGTPLGEAVRSVLLDAPGQHSPRADALLFNAARAELVASVIRPALDRGDVVVCDRYVDSTLAYQGYGDGLDIDGLRRVSAWATETLMPDLTLLLDVPSEVARERRAAGPAGGRRRFEDASRYDAAFHGRVREGFLALAARDPARWRVIDARPAPSDVADVIVTIVAEWLSRSEPKRHPLRIHP